MQFFERGFPREQLTSFKACTRRLSSSPRFRKSAGRYLPFSRAARLPRDVDSVAPSLEDYMSRQKFVLSVFSEMQSNARVTVLLPQRTLCATGTCEAALNGIPLYRDDHHLSVYGATQLTAMMATAF